MGVPARGVPGLEFMSSEYGTVPGTGSELTAFGLLIAAEPFEEDWIEEEVPFSDANAALALAALAALAL